MIFTRSNLRDQIAFTVAFELVACLSYIAWEVRHDLLRALRRLTGVFFNQDLALDLRSSCQDDTKKLPAARIHLLGVSEA